MSGKRRGGSGVWIVLLLALGVAAATAFGPKLVLVRNATTGALYGVRTDVGPAVITLESLEAGKSVWTPLRKRTATEVSMQKAQNHWGWEVPPHKQEAEAQEHSLGR